MSGVTRRAVLSFLMALAVLWCSPGFAEEVNLEEIVAAHQAWRDRATTAPLKATYHEEQTVYYHDATIEKHLENGKVEFTLPNCKSTKIDSEGNPIQEVFTILEGYYDTEKKMVYKTTISDAVHYMHGQRQSREKLWKKDGRISRELIDGDNSYGLWRREDGNWFGHKYGKPGLGIISPFGRVAQAMRLPKAGEGNTLEVTEEGELLHLSFIGSDIRKDCWLHPQQGFFPYRIEFRRAGELRIEIKAEGVKQVGELLLPSSLEYNDYSPYQPYMCHTWTDISWEILSEEKIEKHFELPADAEIDGPSPPGIKAGPGKVKIKKIESPDARSRR